MVTASSLAAVLPYRRFHRNGLLSESRETCALFVYVFYMSYAHTHAHTHACTHTFFFLILTYLRSFLCVVKGQPACTVSMSGLGWNRDVPQLCGKSGGGGGCWEQEKHLNVLQVGSCLQR